MKFIRADPVHALAPAPLVPNRIDIATVLFSQVAYYKVQPNEAGFWGRIARTFASWIENRAYRKGRVRMLTALAPGGVRELERDHPGVPVRLTPHVLQAERFYPDARVRANVRRELGASTGQVITLFVNNTFWEHKGLAIAMAALSRAAPSVPALGDLWVVGSGPVEQFREIAVKLGIGDRVRFLGHRGDIERIYRGADVLLHPARYETFSLAVHEAAASGLAVVATRTNGVEDLVEDGEAGIMVERNVEAVTEAIVRLALDAGLRERMGRVGRERALAFRPARFTSGVLQAYRQLSEE